MTTATSGPSILLMRAPVPAGARALTSFCCGSGCGGRGCYRQPVGAVVQRLVSVLGAGLVAAHPVPADRGMPGDLGLERHHEILVLDRVAAGGSPPAALPPVDPLRHRVEHQARVGDDAGAAAGRE